MQEIDHFGNRGPIKSFDEKKLEALLEKPEVAEVAVFRLKEGMVLNIQGTKYLVKSVRTNEKVILKRLKQDKPKGNNG